tara:strand:- start:9 stop:596 length:588 start_codon:yes stop_codon:yes gene_type:complete
MAFFKASKVKVKESTGFKLIDKGTYKCSIFEQKVFSTPEKVTLKLGFAITDFESKFANRKVWYNFNIKHPSSASQAVSEKMLDQLMAAIGREGEVIECPSELEFKALRAFIVINNNDNDIGKFLPVIEAKEVAGDAIKVEINILEDSIIRKQELTAEEVSTAIDDALDGFDDIKEEVIIELPVVDVVEFDKDIPF